MRPCRQTPLPNKADRNSPPPRRKARVLPETDSLQSDRQPSFEALFPNNHIVGAGRVPARASENRDGVIATGEHKILPYRDVRVYRGFRAAYCLGNEGHTSPD